MKIVKTKRKPFQILSHLFITIAILFAFATPTFAYEEDTHFIMTYVLCRSVGFTHEEALVVAAVNQGMDDSVSVAAHDDGKPQVEEEWRWHALDKDGDMAAKGIIARRDQFFKEALEEKDPKNKLIRLGIFFHYQQDTWAHRHHEKSNHLSRNNYTTFNTPTGHGPWGSKPDRPPLDPVAALLCLEDGIVFATKFLRQALGREPTPFLANYKPAGGMVDADWKDKRKGKFFNQLNISYLEKDSARYYLSNLIRAQIDAYGQSRDYNPFYFGRQTPDRAELEKVRAKLQSVLDLFKSSLGSIEIPTQEQKLAQGFTSMTTEILLNLSASSEEDKTSSQ